ncbi:tyrosine-type recombinase/integrase [Gordonia sp. VNK1]|uniref:tyrosine-type recombinase/integrase n=1 Tax=Gordonia oleivorans TaxID=3156618 RepID=UPI0032B44C41
MTAPIMVHLDAWRVWQHAQRLSLVTITERIRVVALFGAEMDVEPARSCDGDIVGWLHSHPEWSDSTVTTYHSYLSSWFKWLQVTDRREDNPMMKVGTPHYPDRQPRPVSDDDVVRLLSTRMWRSTRVMILLALLAGLRVSEIARVRGEDVDAGAGVLWVKGKGRKVRSIPLHPTLIEAASTMPAKGYWFPMRGHPHTPMHGKSVSDVVSRTMRRAEVPGTPHCLRHWYATTLLDDGADLRTVQELMRHKTIQSTAVYTKVPDARRKSAVARLDPLRSVTGAEHRVYVPSAVGTS